MSRVIKTEFDGTIEEDVQLESIGGKQPPVAEVLANAENIYKSFLYFRKMFSDYPQKEQTAAAGTVSNSDFAPITLTDGANRIVVKNYGSATASIRINGSEYVLLPGEREEIPITAKTEEGPGDAIELRGDVSYLLKIVQEF